MPPLPAYDHALTGDAVICEVRRLRRLPHLLASVRAQLSAAWTVHLMHGPESDRDVRASAALQPAIASGALRLRKLELAEGTDFSGRTWYNEYVSQRARAPLRPRPALRRPRNAPPTPRPTRAAARRAGTC